MKTQINTLVSGDFQTNTLGTSQVIRMQVAQSVISENHDTLEIELRGEKMLLTASWSRSGKSVTYFGSMPLSLYAEMFGDFCIPKESPKAYIQVNGDMTVWASTNSKKRAWQIIAEKEITIL